MRVFVKVTGAVAASLVFCIVIWAAGKYQVAQGLFSTEFLAHQYCFLRQPSLIWTNAVSDGLIWLSYSAIAAGLLALLWKSREYLPFHWLFVAFGIFIVACGFTHFFEMVTIWNPVYWLSTSMKGLTAIASVATAIAFVPLVPRAAGAIRLFNEAYAKSEQQRAETYSKLLDTEERMKLAVASAGIATWEWNLASEELIWDERCRAIFGVSEIRPLRYEDFLYRVHPEDRAHTQMQVETALADRREYNAAFRVLRDDGEVRNVISRGRVFVKGKGQPVRFVGTIIDVTRERQAEEALEKAEKLAVAGRMAASIAHEINNPLDAAMGLIYLSRTDASLPEHINEHLKLVESELQRATQITRSTLNYYRESPNPVPTDIVGLIESVLHFQHASLSKAGVTVRKDLVAPHTILAFPGELRQICTNLVSNAIEAMQGGGTLVVRVHPAKDWSTGRDGYRLVIADNGSGVHPEAQKKLFEPFFTTKGEKGTGLGIWITRQLVRKHGGFIKFRSHWGLSDGRNGTTFAVWLPLRHDFRNVIRDSTTNIAETSGRTFA